MKVKIWCIFFIVFAAIFLSSCESLIDECETKNTGTFYIENASSIGKAYEIHIDGINYGIVGAGQIKEWELAAGAHVVQILFADSNKAACSVSAPTVIKCQKTGLRCDT